MKILSALLFIMVISSTYFLIQLERQLDDCRFEYTHLKTKLSRLQELSDYALIFEQLLPPGVAAAWKAGNAMILNEKYRNYEAAEQPLITEKEIGG